MDAELTGSHTQVHNTIKKLPKNSIGISLKNWGLSDVEMFEILPSD